MKKHSDGILRPVTIKLKEAEIEKARDLAEKFGISRHGVMQLALRRGLAIGGKGGLRPTDTD